MTIARPNGAVIIKRVTTGTTGRAVVKLSLKKQDPAGTYSVVSSVTTGGLTG